jgi:hypothetical protein
MVPAYYRSPGGRVYRVYRVSQTLDAEQARYILRAVPIRPTDEPHAAEAVQVVDAEMLRDRIRLRQVVPTPEQTYEQLWQQLRLDLD